MNTGYIILLVILAIGSISIIGWDIYKKYNRSHNIEPEMFAKKQNYDYFIFYYDKHQKEGFRGAYRTSYNIVVFNESTKEKIIYSGFNFYYAVCRVKSSKAIKVWKKQTSAITIQVFKKKEISEAELEQKFSSYKTVF